jgi:hypothetical protein
MALQDWIRDTKTRVQTEGIAGVAASLDEFRIGILRRLYQLNYSPTPIWEKEWDVLIVLDACRYDLMTEFEAEFEFLENRNQLVSTASSTVGWVETNFAADYDAELSETAYITGNPNSIRALPYEFPQTCECGTDLFPEYDDIYHLGETICEHCGAVISGNRRSPFLYLEEVWRDSWDNDIGTNLPRPITDAAIRTHRNQNPTRMIVHYMQPHYPFVTAPDLAKGARISEGDRERVKQSRTVWEKVESGDISQETVRGKYRENLRHVLEDVEILLENIDAETAVISSDHGNAIGEHGIYGHPPNTPIPALVHVPWYTIAAQDKETYEPECDRSDEEPYTASKEVKSRLQDLGYH